MFHLNFRCPNKTAKLICDIGYFSPGKQVDCSSCLLGFKCPTTGMVAPIQCTLGRYQHQTGKSSCIKCEIGKYCNNTLTPGAPCPSGLYSLENYSVCLTCPAGYRYAVIYFSLSITVYVYAF